MPEPLEWLSRTRLVDEVADVLRDRIYSGRYPPGEALRQVQISQELKVSRTPLREALRMLEREGIVKAEVGGGVSVIQADYGRLIDAYALREVIDGLAARLAAERSPDAVDRVLIPTIELQKQAMEPWEPVVYTRANVDFHTAIIELSANEFLAGQLPIIRMTSQIFTPISLIAKDRAELAIQEHLAIADAIRRGAGAEAERLAHSHIRRTVSRLKSRAGPAAAPRTRK